jgi:ABC-type Fe3+-hydroxamate transport system substrate-binding protein
MIDTPSPFATLDEWESYLRDLLQIVQPDTKVKQLINEAREQIEQLKKRV